MVEWIRHTGTLGVLFGCLAESGPARGATLDVTRTLVYANAEDIALAGANAAYAGAPGGTAMSPAAPANRRAEATAPVTFGLLLLQSRLSGPEGGLDPGNLGAPFDGATRAFNLAVVLGDRNTGLGLQSQGADYHTDSASIAVTEGHAALALALLDGRLALGAGPRLLGMRVTADGEHRDFLGSGAEVGAVLSGWREQWSFAVTGRSGVTAGPLTDAWAGIGAARLPAQLILGAGWSNVALRAPGAVPVRLMVDANLDGPVPDALSVEAILEGDTVARGGEWTLSPHVGAEVDVWPDRLRLRAGSYLEPSRTALAGPRPHATGGFELRLFQLHAFHDHMRLNLAWQIGVDVAPRYVHGAWLGINLWQDGQMGGRAAPLETSSSPTDPTVR